MSKVKTSKDQPRRCRECGTGTIRLMAKAGRFMRHKTMQRLEVPADLPLPTCDRCGAEWLREADAKKLTAAMEEVYRTRLRHRAQALIGKLSGAVQKNELERLLGLSQGYLSHLSSGERDPSPALVGQLALLAFDATARLAELRKFWANDDTQPPSPGRRPQRRRAS